MSFVFTAPQTMTDAARGLANLGSTINVAHAVAAAPTTGLLAAGGDEVSTAIAAIFSRHAWSYQALSAQAATFHTQLVQTLDAGAGAYAAAEAANAAPLQTLEQDVLGLINAPTNTLLGRPLIGNGADGTTTANGVGTPGGAGGILWGNGGDGGASTAAGDPGGAGGPAGLLGTGGTGGMGGFGASGGIGGTGGLLWGNGGTGGFGGPTGIGGAGGNALFLGTGGAGGQGGTFTTTASGGVGGTGGNGGLLWGNGGTGGIGGPYGNGGTGGSAQWFGDGGAGGMGGALGNGGVGGNGGHLVGNGGTGGTGGVVSGVGGTGGLGSGQWLGHAGATGAAGGPAAVSLTMHGSRPTLAVSVNGGPTSQATVDTGSSALLFAPKDVNLNSLGAPIAKDLTLDFGAPGDETVVTYTTYQASVNFGHGVLTSPMTVGVISSEVHNGTPLAPETLVGVGANTLSAPFTTTAVQQLPTQLDQGILINEPRDYFQFANANPLSSFANVSGAPKTDNLLVQINDGSLQSTTGAFVDTGGHAGAVPSNLLPDPLNQLAPGTRLPEGTKIIVEAVNGGNATVLYTQVAGPGTAAPYATSAVGSGGQFNTGATPFLQMPIYLSYNPTGGTMYFDNPS